MIKKNNIKKITHFGEKSIETEDVLAIEEPLEISLEDRYKKISTVSVTMRTPGNDEELAVGFLFTEGIIFSRKNLAEKAASLFIENKITIHLAEHFDADLEKLKKNFYTTSSCGVCGKESIEAIQQVCKIPLKKEPIKIQIQDLFSLPEKLRNAQKVFESTGGIHASAFFDSDGNLQNLREDVGRHNALDKLIGSELLKENAENFSLENKILLLSGRASFELIQKSAMAGIQIIGAIGAPSSLAVETAEHFGITLVGFLKNGSCNIYCGAERIIS